MALGAASPKVCRGPWGYRKRPDTKDRRFGEISLEGSKLVCDDARNRICTSLMKTLSVFSALVAAAAVSSASAQTIAQWTFEINTPPDATDTNVIAGIAADFGSGSAMGLHASTATDWTTPAGNGSANSLSVNTWAVNDFFQFRLGTVGYSGLSVSFDQTSSSTGPRDFNLQYSTDGSSFTTFAPYTVLQNGGAPNASWNATTYASAYTLNFDLSSITAIDNAANVYFRLVNSSTFTPSGGTVAAGGTDRVDNFTVYVVPEPTGLLAVGGLMLLAGRKLMARRS